ncbi:RNA polymerase ECF family sigma subunit [Actinocorallia herbida]|uniref:RNA polymerase ECF family sigma subunit n=1 Tax=Actinocorallia herbida TaxID=58109 RepID=A0A3N1CUG2_9ACTN|nr:sigma-70 family RNA polymerase sigma factor [Actinocorallia herbida]ROO84338.1 RNA polymerase ECF family sigma subunit [Actinocorallia herbida]
MTTTFQELDGLTGLGARITRGDEAALAEAYERLAPAIRGYVRGTVPQGSVDDVIQLVFLEVWRCRERFDPARSLEAWVLAIARRRAIDVLRRESRHSGRAVPYTAAAGSWDNTASVGTAQDVRAALARLPEVQREAIALACFGRLTQREIADRLHVPLGTVKARTARGLRRLGELL